MLIQQISQEECLGVLARGRLARLGCALDNQPYVVPIYYSYDRDPDGESYLYGFTSIGQKIEWMRANPLVCVEWDEVAGFDRWESVIAFGHYEELFAAEGGQPEQQTRPPMRATPTEVAEDECPPWRRAHQLLQEHTAWWEPGAAAFAASDHRDHTQEFKPLYYRIHIERITGHRAVPEARHGATVTPARSRADEGWMRKILRRIMER